MPTLNLDPGFFGHRKTKRLIDLLGKGSEVIPIRVWCYCCRYHGDDGMLTGYTAQEIESQVAWWGQSGKAVEAMVTVGFLDVVPGGWKVHDWEDWAGHIVRYHLRAKKGAKARWASKGEENASSMRQACDKHASALHCTDPEFIDGNDSVSRGAEIAHGEPDNLTPLGLAWKFRSLVKGRSPNSQETPESCAAFFEDLLSRGITAETIDAKLTGRGKHVQTIWDFCKGLMPKVKGKPSIFAGLKEFGERHK